mgnify:FL=1
MLKKIFLGLSFFILSSTLFAQTMKVTGTVYDTTGIIPLEKVSVIAVRLKDSLLLGYTRTNKDGFFELSGFPPDTFDLMIEYPSLDEKSYYIFGNDGNNEIDIPSVKLNPKSQDLDEVVIFANKNPIFFRGDTLVYVADSFKVSENAVVEDLLKKLPGISVDENGAITSQGQDIEQVLVDGDEFFGSDPTIATKNLGAKGIETVEVYEKEREGASIGDDDKMQVLDLRLKDDAKKGYFGKITGATDYGLFEEKPFYEGELLYNNFNKKRKVSVFALKTNTPRSNIARGDASKFGLENEKTGNWWDQSTATNTSGIPTTLKAGIYYADRIGKTGKITMNYSYYETELNAISRSQSSYFLKDTTYGTIDSVDQDELIKSHSLNISYKTNLDSLTSIEIRPSFSLDAAETTTKTINEFIGEDMIRSLNTSILNTNASEGISSNSRIKIVRKFMKPKRVLKAEYVLRTEDNSTESELENISNYYLLATSDSIEQDRTNENGYLNQTSKLTYTEPLFDKFRLELEYLYQNNTSRQEIFTKDRLNNDQLVDELSNNFKNLRTQNRGTAVLSYEIYKHLVQAGIGYRNIVIENENLINNNIINQNISNFLPQFRYQYKPSRAKRFNFRYNTQSQQPSVNDLQPVQNNSNPNAIQEGNPDLEPNYMHTLRVNFNSWDALTGRFIWSGINATYTDNAFANETNFDQYGRTISKTINVDGNIYSVIFAGAGFPILNRKIIFEPNMNANYLKNTNFIDSLENITENTSIAGGLKIRFDLDSLEFNIENEYSYVNPNTSLSSFANQPYSTQRYKARIEWRIRGGFMLKADASYSINTGRAVGFNRNIFIVNAELSKSFLKTENLILSINGNDLLNQNINVLREVNGNIITDNFTQIISRYFLMRLTYKFNNKKTKENDYKRWG